MSQNQFIVGGEYAPPEIWLKELKATPFVIELPSNDLRPRVGGDFSILFNHCDITQGQDAWVEVFLKYRSLARNACQDLVQDFESRLEGLTQQRFFSSQAATELATSIGWVKDGRSGVLNELKRIKELGFEIDPDHIHFWKQEDAKLDQVIEFCTYGDLNLATLVAEDVIARAIAKSCKAVLQSYAETPYRDYLKLSSLEQLIQQYKAAPQTWNMSPEVTTEFFNFRPFPGWNEILEEENYEIP